MKILLNGLLLMLVCLAYMLIGAYDIKKAIEHFKKQSYFTFGMDIMWVVFWCANIINVVWR